MFKSFLPTILFCFTVNPLAACDMVQVVVDLNSRREIKIEEAERVHPALLAVKELRGVLIGMDHRGQAAVISCKRSHLQNADDFQSVRQFREFSDDQQIQEVNQLILAYREDIEDSELASLNLQVVERYEKGRYVKVQLSENLKITANLIEKLVNNDKVRYMSPVFRVQILGSRTS